mgnify:CR=1 FL=1
MIYRFDYEYLDRRGQKHIARQVISAESENQALQELKDFCTELNRAIINVKLGYTNEKGAEKHDKIGRTGTHENRS